MFVIVLGYIKLYFILPFSGPLKVICGPH